MHRRQFLQGTAASALVLSFPGFSVPPKTPRMGIVVHSYASRWQSKTPSERFPAFTNALDLLEHCHQIGAGGVQVTVNGWSDDFAKKVREAREKLGLYLEGSIGLPREEGDVARFDAEVRRAREAGAQVLRTVTLGTRRYETFRTAAEFEAFRKKSLRSIELAEPVARKHGVKLAVENHKDWRSGELAAILKPLSSEWVGATIDFGNNLALLEDPTEVVETLAPYALSTHIKDMAVEPYADGFLLSEVPLGKGLLDLPKLVALCRASNPAVTFSLEMITRDPLQIPCRKDDYWATFGDVPRTDLDRTLRFVQANRSPVPLPRVSGLSADERLEAEEANILACLAYSQEALSMT